MQRRLLARCFRRTLCSAPAARVVFSPDPSRRRQEFYHKKVQQAALRQGQGESKSIHDRVVAKQEGLEHFLLYDRYDRNAFRNYLFPINKTFEDFRGLRLDETPEWAKCDY